MGRWIVLAVAGFILYTLLRNELRKRNSGSPAAEGKSSAKPTASMVKDPNCGAYVEAEGAISVRDGDTVHHFCSYECRDAFLKKLQEGGREIPEYKGKSEE